MPAAHHRKRQGMVDLGAHIVVVDRQFCQCGRDVKQCKRVRCGAEIVVHAYRGNGDAPGAARLERMSLHYHAVAGLGISEDLALLLAYEKGAELIVAVGTHLNLIEFLERDRAGMSSTFVTRLKVGEILVDAKGVSRLVSRRVGMWPFALFSLAGLGAIVTAVLASPSLRHVIELISLRIQNLLGL